MKVCYFGIYKPSYARNKILISGLKQNGVEVIECRIEPSEKFKYLKLLRKHRKIGDYDLMLVGFPGQTVMPLAKLIARTPIVLDAFVSLYDSSVFDRKTVSPKSLGALKYWLLDFFSARLADKVLLDTKEHIKYFCETFRLKREKFQKIFIGADDAIFRPREGKEGRRETDDKFLVHFHGNFIPLQGVEYIVGAAKILEKEKIRFNLIGRGQTLKSTKDLARRINLTNTSFIDFMPQ